MLSVTCTFSRVAIAIIDDALGKEYSPNFNGLMKKAKKKLKQVRFAH